MELLDLLAHFNPQSGVKVGKGFVKQEQRGLLDNRTTYRHALALAAGEVLRKPVEQLVQPEHVGGVGDALRNVGLRGADIA